MENIVSLAKLVLPAQIRRNYDADAAAYIAAVEAADGQSLERGVKDAITEFVVGCKIRGIWDAIKSCCLLCGARTVAGATIPLKGNSPILTNFVGNYNRETGLQRTNGSFNINRNNNTDPQDNKHVAVYPTSIDYGTASNNNRSLLTGSTLSGSTFFTVNSLGLNVRVNTSLNIVSNQPVIAGNLMGVSVLDDSRSQLLYNNNIKIININTANLDASNLTLFGGGGVSPSSSRIAFYSVGERLDLRLLDNNLKVFLDSIGRVFDQSYTVQDTDATNYIETIRQVEGVRSMGFTYRQSIDEFVTGCKNDNIWNSISACCVLIGAKNLSSALIPLKGPTPSKSSALINVDYLSFLGVKGSTTGTGLPNITKGIFTNYNNNNNLQDNFHISTFIMANDSRTSEVIFMGVGQNQNGTVQLNSQGVRNMNSFRSFYSNNISNTFYGTSRNNSSNFIFRINNTNTTVNQVSQTPYDANIIVLGAGLTGSDFIAGSTDARLSFYSIGQSLDLALLDNRVNRLVNNISSRRII